MTNFPCFVLQNINGIFKYKIIAVHKIFDTNVTVLKIHPKTGVISAVNAEFIDREDMDNITFKVKFLHAMLAYSRKRTRDESEESKKARKQELLIQCRHHHKIKTRVPMASQKEAISSIFFFFFNF